MSESPTERFSVSTGVFFDQEVVILTDSSDESEAILVPALGFACVAFRVATKDGTWPVLAEPPDADSLLNRTSRFGIPILYPWPNRIRHGAFSYDGETYQMPLAPNGPHAIHGVVRGRPWGDVASGTDADGAFCRASIVIGESADDVWPFPSRLTVEYRLAGRTLSVTAEATNTGVSAMLMGYGLHPWFGMPLGPGGSKQTLEVRTPADRFWELDETLCTTGAIWPVADGFDARSWRAVGDRFVDDVYTGLPLTGGWFAAEIRDPASGRSVAVRSDAGFREHVVFAPLHGLAVCLEPYTCTTDAFNLNNTGIDAGTIELEPGGSWRGVSVIEASA